MAEGSSDIVEVPSVQDSGSDSDDNLYLPLKLRYAKKKREFLEWVKVRA